MGGLLRIIPNREDGGDGYTLPAGNMAAVGGFPESDPALFVYGLRSPWRGSRDSLGRIWVGDVGQGLVEEVNLITAVGQNFGWATHEGPCDPALLVSGTSDAGSDSGNAVD